MLRFFQNEPPTISDDTRSSALPRGLESVFATIRTGVIALGSTLRANVQFVRDYTTSLFLRFAEAGLRFVVILVFARILGEGGFGHYAYAIAWATTLAVIGQLGFTTASIRFVAVYSSGRQWGLLRGYLRFSTRVVLLLSLLTMSALAAVSWATWLLRGDVSAALLYSMLVGALILPSLSLLQVGQSILRGFGRLTISLAPQAVVVPLVSLACAGLLYLWYAGRETVPAWMITSGHLVGILAALAIVCVGIRHVVTREIPSAQIETQKKYWLASASRMTLVAGFARLLSYIDILMLGIFCGTTIAGIYTVASRLAGLLVFLQHANTIVIAPLAAKAHVHQTRSDLQHLFTLSARANLLLTIPGVVAVVVLGKFFLGLMGEGFEVAYVPLLILLAGQAIRNLSGQLGVALNMTGHEALSAKALAVCVVVNVILNASLIPLYGAWGAAVATATAVVVWRVILTVLVWKYLGIVACALPIGISGRDGDYPTEER